MGRLVVVSNRVSSPRERGSRAGGLAIAVGEAMHRRGGLWFGWSGQVSQSPAATPSITTSGAITYATVDLSEEEHQRYYVGYSNSTLWPLLHYRLGLIAFRRADYESYRRVNARMAAALAPMLRPDDTVWIHDYHLIPFARELRAAGVGNRIGFFLHVPFPARQVFCVLPQHASLLEDLCHYDLIGFQTRPDADAFLDCVREAGGGRDFPDGRVEAFGRNTHVAAFPIGIETAAFEALAAAAADAPETKRLKESLAGRGLIIGVDRLDYSKGLLERVEAFSQLLANFPAHRSKVTYMQIAPLSREDVAQYRTLRRDLERAAGRVNGQFAEFDWAPVRYLNKSFPRRTLASFYRASRVGLVTPLRDGMNLVAKEYVAAQDPDDPGALILSRFAGAAQELSAAILVNPYDSDHVAGALHQAICMPQDERQHRWRTMMAVLRANDVANWRQRFLTVLEAP